jgi:hypothetical protein
MRAALMAQAPQLTLLMQVAVEFTPLLSIADGAPLTRRILHARTGSFGGRDVRGDVVAGGDWVLVRGDGSAELDIRFTLKTVEQELLFMRGTGLFVADSAVATRIRAGDEVAPAEYYFRTAILFETGSARLRHFNHRLHLGVGQRTATGMLTDVFTIA